MTEVHGFPRDTILPVEEGYDRWAPIYDSDGNPLVALEEPHVIRMLGDVRGLTIADVGTGTGRHAIRMAAAGAKVVAIDLSSGMMAKARGKAGADRVEFVRADCTRTLPLRDVSFDRVLCCLVAEHVSSLEKLFLELARISRRDGFIVLTTVHPAMHLQGVRARFTDPETGTKIYPRGYEYTVSDYVMAAARSGLSFDEISEWLFDERTAKKISRTTAVQYVDWPMLLAMRVRHQ